MGSTLDNSVGHLVSIPPSMVNAAPLFLEASSATKKRAKVTMSSGLPSRFIRVLLVVCWTMVSAFSKAFAESQIKGVFHRSGANGVHSDIRIIVQRHFFHQRNQTSFASTIGCMILERLKCGDRTIDEDYPFTRLFHFRNCIPSSE